MQKAVVDGIPLEYEVLGNGEPVVLIHGALIADSFQTLLAEPSLVERYSLITYHRRGYTGSGNKLGPTSIARQAADCVALLSHLGVERAHILGHSYGGCIALQLALDTPEVVHSLALLEPAFMAGDSTQGYRNSLVRAQQRFKEDPAPGLVADFMKARWPGYSTALDRTMPGAFSQAVADAATTFESELPALVNWEFLEADARRITQPALTVLGGGSVALSPRFGETYQLLLNWLPQAEGFVLPKATHFLHLESQAAARGMAVALAEFFARHPIPVGS